MGYWGWRPLIMSVFISVWVVGCNIVSNAAPGVSPTPSPRVTLTLRQPASPTPSPREVASATAPSNRFVYIAQPNDTPAEIARRFGVDPQVLASINGGLGILETGQEIFIPNAAAITPVVVNPTCSETPSGSLLCLGEVRNPLDVPLEAVTLDVMLVHTNGDSVIQTNVETAQTLIPAGESSPYRVLFNTDSRHFTYATALLRSLRIPPADDSRYVRLAIQDTEGYFADGRYRVTGILYNGSADVAHSIRLVVTLRDSAGIVMGYRVVELDEPLAPGSQRAVSVELLPQTASANLLYTLAVEARRGEG